MKDKSTAWGKLSEKPKSAFSFPKELRGKLAEVNPQDPQGRTHGRIIVDKVVTQAEQGNMRATGEILDRLLGKAAQSVNLKGDMTVTSREERVQNILEKLSGLESGKDEPGNQRVM